MYWANIAVIGGLGEIEAFGERLYVETCPGPFPALILRERDLRALCPTDYEVGIYEAYE